MARAAAARDGLDADHDCAAVRDRLSCCLIFRWALRVLLAAMLAPTDPVLASDVQLANPNDRDSVRFSLTGEGGLNDGAAFPFVMLGLALLGLRDQGSSYWRWVTLDLIWPERGGLAIGVIADIRLASWCFTCGRDTRKQWASTSS